MNTETLPYRYAKHLTIAGCLALATLVTAIIYACHTTPYTMMLFLGGGSMLLVAAVVLFVWVFWKEIRAQLDSIVTKQFSPGQVIFRQGDPAEHVFVITKGHIEAVYADPAKGEVIVGRLGPDEFFGEGAILSRVPRQVTVRAVDDLEVLMIHRTDFVQMFASLPRVRERVQAQQAHRKALLKQAPGSGSSP